MAGGESGLPLGVLRLHGYAPESAAGKDPYRPIEAKESYRWLEAYQDATAIAALIRSLFENVCCGRAIFQTRSKTVSRPGPRQRDHAAKPSTPGPPALRARTAKVEGRFREVTLRAPQAPQTRDKPPLKLWAVYVVELHPPKGAIAVRWLLLTSLPITSVKQALKCIRWYCRRWRIKEWPRVMKSGGKILDHQNHRAQVLLRAIALAAVIAWRIMRLALLGRAVPELPADILFDCCECAVLGLLVQRQALPR